MYRAVISLNNALRHLECIRLRSELAREGRGEGGTTNSNQSESEL